MENSRVPKLGYSKREASEASSLSVRSLDYLIEKKKLAAVKVGRRVVILRKSLEKLLHDSNCKPTAERQ